MEDLKDKFVGIELIDPVEPDPANMHRNLRVVCEKFGSRFDRLVRVSVDYWIGICYLRGIGSIFESSVFVHPSVDYVNPLSNWSL